MRIIAAETSPGHWMAWTTDAPQDRSGGTDVFDAVRRLLKAIGRSSAEFRLVPSLCTGRRVVLEEIPSEVCPDCGGSGRYVGLNAVEPCRACGGTGRA